MNFTKSGIVAAGLMLAAFVQAESLLPGVSEAQITAALEDLSVVYGHPVERFEQAKAICNLEKYLADCAEIGQKHDLFGEEEKEQVDVVLSELKGRLIEDLKSCQDTACLVGVANRLARGVGASNTQVARALELTPQKIQEKQNILEAAKEVGVDFEACRTMDPDTASLEVLRSCAKLAKHKSVQQYVPEAVKRKTELADGSVSLRESLERGEYQCGNGTLSGCGNYCLNPTQEQREGGISAVAPVCRQIAERFFGKDGVQELETAYTNVQQSTQAYSKRAEQVLFTTLDGKILNDPAAIGRYMEEQGKRGNVTAVEKGMDFLVLRGFVSPQDKVFALSMVRKIQERGVDIDFDRCRTNPQACQEFIPEEQRAEFDAMAQVEAIMRSEMTDRGIPDPSLCESNPQLGEACIAAGKAALPKIETIAQRFPQVQFIVEDIRRHISFGDQGFEARRGIEERFQKGEQISFGEQNFNDFRQVEEFCRQNGQLCLTETAKQGLISRDFAAEKYERYYEVRPGPYQEFQQPGQGLVPQGQIPGFSKEEALKQFQQWLDNPQGPPPVPTFPGPGQPIGLFPSQTQFPQSPYYYPYPTACPQVFTPPCAPGEYRQESRDQYGCATSSQCIPLTTATQPPVQDNRFICPSLPTVDSCPAGQEKVVSFSSPECGTYYSCAAREVQQQQPVPYGTDCGKYGSAGWHPMDNSGNCFSSSMTDYYNPAGSLIACSAKPVYGCSSGVTTPVPSSSQKEQIWNSSGLRSSIRADADPAKIESLKQACANTPQNSNIWMPSAGDYASPDFGMPDPNKCERAASCTSNQYFDGASCVGGTVQPVPTTPTGQKQQTWNSLGLSSSIRADADPARIESLKQSCSQVRPSSSPYIWEPGSGDYSSPNFGMPNADKCQRAGSCTSDQYFDGASCVGSTSTTPTTVTGSCSSELVGLLGDGCHNMGNAWFNGGMSSYVWPGTTAVIQCSATYAAGCTGSSDSTAPYPTSTSTSTSNCPSGYHYMGDAGGYCMSDSDTSTCQPLSGGSTYTCSGYIPPSSSTSSSSTPPACSSDQYWDGTACVSSSTTSPSPSPSTSCSSSQYWDGSACVTSPTPSPTSYFCPSGHAWDGRSCVFSSVAAQPSQSASVFNALANFLGKLFGR